MTKPKRLLLAIAYGFGLPAAFVAMLCIGALTMTGLFWLDEHVWAYSTPTILGLALAICISIMAWDILGQE